MKIIFDYDTHLYKACYMICSFSDIRNWFNEGRSKEWMTKEIVELSINRLSQMNTPILEAIEETGIIVTSSEYYVTTCFKSIRKKFYPEYKETQSRKNNRQAKWVKEMRKELNYTIGCDIWEADDLVIDRAKQLDYKNCVIVSEDKDVNKGCPGLHFDTYWVNVLDEDFNPVLDVFNNPIKEYRGLTYVTPVEAKKFFWRQMMEGDSTDNIKGCYRITQKRINEILSSNIEDIEGLVKKEYLLSEYRVLKSKINASSESDPKIKKLTFNKFVELIETGKYILDKDYNKIAEKNYYLHQLLVGLGSDRKELIKKLEKTRK